MKTGSEIAIYIFEHTKCTLLDEAKTEKIFMKILSTKNDLSYSLGSMLKLMGNHLISQNINYHIFLPEIFKLFTNHRVINNYNINYNCHIQSIDNK